MMTLAIENLTDAALGLPVQERAKLAHILIASIDDNAEADPSTAWDMELQKRANDIRMGKVNGIPAETVFAKLKEKYH